MHPRFFKIGFFVAGVATIGGLLFQQGRTNAGLRLEAERLRLHTAGIESLQAGHRHLASKQTPPGELAALKTAEEEAARLRAEAIALRQQAEKRRISDEKPSPPPPMEKWPNAGPGTALAALQACVSAGLQADTETLAGLITFDAAGRALLDALFERLPPETRALHASAENVFAVLLAARLPQDLTSAEIITSTPAGPDAETLLLRLTREDGSTKDANFKFTRDTGSWRIVVPPIVVGNYLSMLKGSPPPPPTPRSGSSAESR